MKQLILSSVVGSIFLSMTGCATVDAPPTRVVVPEVQEANLPNLPNKPMASKLTLKRKIAVARFSNSTNYGKGLLFDGENDPLADQALDMLVKRLVTTQRFLVFERDNIDEIRLERKLLGKEQVQDLVGVDAVIIGSVTQFGRKTEGQVGFLSSTKKQTVVAAVEARLVDPRTGLAFFSASGSGEASVESGEVAGFGSRAAYDASLNDRAIAVAISDLTSEIIGNLDDRPWSTDVLRIGEGQLFISGGPKQGLKIGDRFVVESLGEVIKSGQSGLPIVLPGKKVAQIEIISFFGETEYSEGSIARITSGSVSNYSADKLIVKDVK